MKILFIISFLFLSCYHSERNCKNFKTGKFRVDYIINGKKTTTFFERNDSIEIEIFKGKKDTSTIRWLNDCEYILQKRYAKNKTKQKPLNIKIMATSKNSYNFEFGFVNSNEKQTAKAVKISEISKK